MTFILTVIFLITVIVGVVLAFLIMPRVSDRADMDMLTADYAHRGLWNKNIPENSMPAFAMAVEKGFGIELDVRLSSDGVIMVFHDPNIKRMCGLNSRIEVNKASVLKTLRLQNTEYTIPTLEDVLTLVDGRVPLLIEIKGEGREERLCRALAEALDMYPGAFAVQSFDPRVLRWFKRFRPRFPRGQIVTRVRRIKGKKAPRLTAFLLSNLFFNAMSRPDFISVSGARMKNIPFRICVGIFKCRGFVWTVRNQNQYRTCRGRGLYTIFERFLPY